MAPAERKSLTVEATIKAPVEKVWVLWTDPRHITQWNNASDDWHTPEADNDLRPGGKFRSRMEAKDGSAGFDFDGIYKEVVEHQLISYALADGRKVQVHFNSNQGTTTVTEVFEADSTHSLEMQQTGWQAILDNFKKYVESSAQLEKLHFKVLIDAPVNEVYARMLSEEDYPKWTAIFNPGSHFKGSWEKGSKIVFLGSDEKGEMGGMLSRIKENIPYRFVSIEHLGLVQNGQEITSGAEVEAWAGALENYTFKEADGKTEVLVETDSNEEYAAYFSETWPKALNKLKAICEQK